jgi:magnesium-transporting ATPase (P-type)
MITGDNVYTGVQTAFSSGIILPTERVLVCEAKNLIDPVSFKITAVAITNSLGIFH